MNYKEEDDLVPRIFPHQLAEMWMVQQDKKRVEAFDWWRKQLSQPLKPESK